MADVRFTRYGAFTRIRVKTSNAKSWLLNHSDALHWHGAIVQWHGAVDLPRHANRIARMMRGDGLSVAMKGRTK